MILYQNILTISLIGVGIIVVFLIVKTKFRKYKKTINLKIGETNSKTDCETINI